MNLHITKSKNSESFYVCKSFINDKGYSTSTIIRKLGTLDKLLIEHGPTRDDVVAWAKNEVKLETEKYKNEQEIKSVQITFHANRPLAYSKQRLYQGGYLFPQSIYYALQLDKTCRKIKAKHKYEFDLNAILSDLIYNRILDPQSKLSAY